MNKSFRIKVPGTSANMGPGFDAMGFALNIYNIYEFREIEKGIKFKGFEEEYCNEDNIIYKAMQLCFEKGNYKINGLEISEVKRDIPVSRGLGSSSACIVSGILGANKIMNDILTEEEILDIAVKMEGHPDNVAPAILGGVVISVMDGSKTYYQKIKPKNEYKYYPIIPNFKLQTEDARKVLPKTLNYSDAIFNISRTGMMIAALINGDDKVLKIACEDAMHEPYRGKLIKGFDLIKKEAYNNEAIASFLSGAGPTIMNVLNHKNSFMNEMQHFLNEENLAYNILELDLDMNGATIEGGN